MTLKLTRAVGAVVLALSVAASAGAQTLSTTPANNGTGGVFMTFTPLLSSLRLTSFETYFASDAGESVKVGMWVRSGAYGEFMSSSEGWTLVETLSGVSAGRNALATLSLNNSLDLLMGTSTSVYLHTLIEGGGIRYHGTGDGIDATTWANADLEMFSADGQTGFVPFSGTQFTPRTFAGNVNYVVVASVPEPSTALLLLAAAFGGVATIARRRSA